MSNQFLPNKIILIDLSRELVDAWKAAFKESPNIEVFCADYFSKPADAMVSPANSFGIMDGGLDLPIRDNLGCETEGRLRKKILEEYHGELPVGSAVIVTTENTKWPYLVSAPTMRIPTDVSNSLNAYYAFRAVLLAIRKFNQEHGELVIKSVVCSGLCTGFGYMQPTRCANQMEIAYSYLSKPAYIPDFEEIRNIHRKLHQ